MDIAWMVFAHEVFQDIAATFGLAGMPDFLRADDVTAEYTRVSGVPVGDLTWYRLHAAVQWACVFLRTTVRQVHFGEIEQPEDPEGAFHHRALFERLLAEVGA
jgi:aminoglycoside phosphotransferase (APT) family kinase protein